MHIAINIALTFTPLFKESINSLMVASSLVLTIKMPNIDKNTPMAAIIIGANTAFCCIVGFRTNADAPSAAVESIEPQYDSYKSAPIPATSPTLSPTLSAIVAGLRGSSSGIPASTLPTKSAPTSAALVYIPPPTRANRACVEAPIPKVSIVVVIIISLWPASASSTK